MNRIHRIAGATGVVVASLAGVTATAGQASAATYVRGQVMCADQRPVVGVWIVAANGGSGWATRSNINGYTQNYAFSLPRGGNYAVNVGCGGSPSNWATNNKSSYVSGSYNSFTCYDTTSAGQYYKYCERT